MNHSRSHAVALIFVVCLVVGVGVSAAAPVICQKGKHLTLRNGTCLGKETKVKLGAEAVDLPVLPPGPPTCTSDQVLTSEGGTLRCVDLPDESDGPSDLICSVQVSVTTLSTAGDFIVHSPDCPSGEVTGGGFRVQGLPPPGLIVDTSKVDPNDPARWLCSVVVPPDSSVKVECLVHCCELE